MGSSKSLEAWCVVRVRRNDDPSARLTEQGCVEPTVTFEATFEGGSAQQNTLNEGDGKAPF